MYRPMRRAKSRRKAFSSTSPFEGRAHPAQRVGHALHAALLGDDHQLAETQPLLQVELAHHPEVDEGEHAGVEVDEQIARMRIGVEEAVHRQLLDERAECVAGDLVAVEAGRLDRLDVADLDALDELLGDDLGGREVGVDGRHVHAGQGLHVLGEAQGVVGLAAIVELLEDAGRELLEHADDVERPYRLRAARRRRAPRSAGCRGRRGSRCVICGRCTLTATCVPSCSVARCTWAVEAAANGSGSNVAYSSSGGAPSSSMMSLAHLVAGERRDGVLQLGELGRHVDRQHGRLARHDLADLHVGRAELLEHEPDLDGRARLLPALGGRRHTQVCIACRKPPT